MARPIKKGLSYFPLDVHAFEDPKLESLLDHYGPFGGFVYIQILSLVYREGYYLKITSNELAIKLLKIMGHNWIRVDKVREIIHSCVELGLLERALFLQGVITSVSIQKQFILSTKRRKNINIDKYWLLDQVTMNKLGVLLSMQISEDNVNNNLVSVDNNLVNVDINTQSKSKSKSKSKIDKKIIIDKSIYGFPKMHYLTQLIISRKYIKEFDADIMKYNSLFESAIETYTYENVLSGVNYLISYSKNPGVPIDDKYNFMKISLLNNLERFKKLENGRGETFEKWFQRSFLQVDR